MYLPIHQQLSVTPKHKSYYTFCFGNFLFFFLIEEICQFDQFCLEKKNNKHS